MSFVRWFVGDEIIVVDEIVHAANSIHAFTNLITSCKT